MATTPEGRIKKMVRKTIERYKKETPYEFWPVPSGFGASSLDCLLCFKGKFIAIETKAPGKKPTPRQDLTISEIIAAGGIVLVIDSEAGCARLDALLEELSGGAT